jgi:hypothetical protein
MGYPGSDSPFGCGRVGVVRVSLRIPTRKSLGGTQGEELRAFSAEFVVRQWVPVEGVVPDKGPWSRDKLNRRGASVVLLAAERPQTLIQN